MKPCLHTQLPEHNKSYRKVSRGWGHLITRNGRMMGHLNSFSASGGRNLNKNFPKIQMPGVSRGGMLKLRFDWYITLEDFTISVKLSRIDFTSSFRRFVYDFRRVSLLCGKILLGCDITCKIEKRQTNDAQSTVKTL